MHLITGETSFDGKLPEGRAEAETEDRKVDHIYHATHITSRSALRSRDENSGEMMLPANCCAALKD